MEISNNFNLQSIPNFEVNIKPLTLLSSINFMSQEKSNKPLAFLKKFILKVSNLDEKQMETISLQDAVSVAMYYRLVFDPNKMIVPNMGIDATMFHRAYNKEISLTKTITIGKYRFTPLITLENAILAETYAINSNQSNLLGLYIMASGCMKSDDGSTGGIVNGWKEIGELLDDEDGRGKLIEYNRMIGEYGNVKISLLEDTPTEEDSNKTEKTISISTQGGTAYAVGFLQSNLLKFGL